MNNKKAKKLRRLVDKQLDKHPDRKENASFYYKQAKKLVRAGVITVCAMLIVNICYADKLGIPSVNPLKFQKNLAEKGFKLDFNFVEKTPDSWGILSFDDKGMCINTYHSIDTEKLPIITEAMWASVED